jgi:hypothetical protein
VFLSVDTYKMGVAKAAVVSPIWRKAVALMEAKPTPPWPR